MTEPKMTNPKAQPEKAAHEALLALCQAGAFGNGSRETAAGDAAGHKLGKAAAAFHQALTDHYRKL